MRSRAGRKVSQPYYHHAVDNGMLAIAGLWSTWTGPEGQDVLSCALLTKDAAGPVADIHHRMPVILRPEQFDLGLSPSTSSEQVHGAIALSREDFAAPSHHGRRQQSQRLPGVAGAGRCGAG